MEILYMCFILLTFFCFDELGWAQLRWAIQNCHGFLLCVVSGKLKGETAEKDELWPSETALWAQLDFTLFLTYRYMLYNIKILSATLPFNCFLSNVKHMVQFLSYLCQYFYNVMLLYTYMLIEREWISYVRSVIFIIHSSQYRMQKV